MITADHTIEILVPVAEDVPEEIGLTDSLSGLEGKIVGLLENRKYHADTFMQELEQTLLNDYGVKKVIYSRKSTYTPTTSWRSCSASATPSSTPSPIEAPARRGVSTTPYSPNPGASPRSA